MWGGAEGTGGDTGGLRDTGEPDEMNVGLLGC